MKKICLCVLGCVLAVGASAQDRTLTPQQQADFAAAEQSFGAGQWADALAKLRPLHDAIPADTSIAKFTADAALSVNDNAYALTLLNPVLIAAPDDWQAEVLMARYYAATHHDAERDAAIAGLVKQHAALTIPTPFRSQTQFLVERVPTAKGRVDIYYSLVPWSGYNIYQLGRVFDAAGKQTFRITLESADMEQPRWAKQHPKEAAAGQRMFSMDGYSEQTGANGQTTQAHFTFEFFDGQPDYNTVKGRMVAIANGKVSPKSSTTGIPMQH